MDSVVADIEDAGFDDVVIVGHSLAELTVPGVVTKLGASRVREMVFAAAFVPPEGTAVVDTLPGPVAWYARRTAEHARSATLPNSLAGVRVLQRDDRVSSGGSTATACTPDRRPSSSRRSSRRDMPDDVPRTWILTLRDRALSVKSQRRSIEALGGVQTVHPDGHLPQLDGQRAGTAGEILVERCRRYA